MALISKLPSTIPTSLFNTWHKLVRYKHHYNCLILCTKKNRIPKGLILNFNLELAKDNDTLVKSCKQHLQATSFNLLKDITAASLLKTKDLQRNLEKERAKLFSDFNTRTANTIWKHAKNSMLALEWELRKIERQKLAKAQPIDLVTELTPTDTNTIEQSCGPGKRRFRRKLRNTTRKDGQRELQVPLTEEQEIQIPDLNPINLTATELKEDEKTLLRRGPSFCPLPKDINWQKVQDDVDKFERRIRIADFFHRKQGDEDTTLDSDDLTLPKVPSKSKWKPPKSSHPEVELFLSNIRKDILNPDNVRKPRDNLTRGERVALKDLKSQEDKVIRIQDKGSRFVLLDTEEYKDKMLSQLNNPLHYNIAPVDPTEKHMVKIRNWCEKWLSEGQISPEIADWLTEIEPRPGTAFGNVKTHKQANPLRLITSCCGTAIERLSAFTEFYLKPLAQKLPSFIKDTTDLLNKIEQLNENGPLPDYALLVSWDVVSMFPNIDNHLGIKAVRNALETRDNKFPPTECIVEAVEICLVSNNSQFNNIHFVQKHGTAMGPKNACSYADLAMGLIDHQAKFEGAIKPNLWWRYRDDVFDIWTAGLERLQEFTEYINSLYPTIRFTIEHSAHSLNVLDLTLHLKEGFIHTDVYAKPTDSHLYLPFSSSHPFHCKKSIPYGVALRLNRNCSSNDYLNKRCSEYKKYLTRQGYNSDLVDQQFRKARNLKRQDILRPKEKNKRKVFPLVVDYNPRLPDITKIIKKHSHLLKTTSLKEIFPPKSIMPAYRRTKNLKDILAPSKLKSENSSNEPGCFKCSKKCDLCKNYLIESNSFQSFSTGRIYKIKETISCTSTNVIYLVSCTKCKLQYVGSTSNQFKVRFRNHKSAMRTNKKTCETAIHFNNSAHSLNDFQFICIEKINSISGVDRKLLTREAYWAAQLHTLSPYGLNIRQEFRSKNRINYNS